MTAQVATNAAPSCAGSILDASCRRLRDVALYALLATFLASAPPPSYSQVPFAGAVTVGAFIAGLKSLVQQLEQSASSLIVQGNNALAQQQLLLAGTLKQTIQQVSDTYATSLNKTFDQLNTAELNAFRDLTSTVNELKSLEGKTSDDVQSLVYKTQGASNQLLDRMPLTKRSPVFYGVSVRDMMNNPAQSPSDVEMLGFAFTDPRLKFKKPIVKIAGLVLPDSALSVQNDRIQVQIPDTLKKSVGFSAGVCSPRTTFPIDLQVFYAVPKLWGLWHSEESTPFHANALAGQQIYTASVTYSGVRTTTSSTATAFTADSAATNVGCENSQGAQVVFTAPAGATDITCAANWVSTSNIKNQAASGCTVTGQTAIATGAITGRDKVVFNCPGGGHGTLRIAGTYQLPRSETAPLSNIVVGHGIALSRGTTSITIPASDPMVTISDIAVVFNKKACAAVEDQLAISLPANRLQGVSQTSAQGNFNATYRQGQLTLTRAGQ